MSEKPLSWLGSSLQDIREFPKDARQQAGHSLDLVQNGLEPPGMKPMHTVGPGVYEICIHTKLEHRVFYIAKYRECLYVLHAFQKTTKKTAQSDIDLARQRLKQLIMKRKARHEPE